MYITGSHFWERFTNIAKISKELPGKLCLLGSKHSNNRNINRLHFAIDVLKAEVCESSRIVREGCGGTESGVCGFVFGTYPQTGSAPPPPPGQEMPCGM